MICALGQHILKEPKDHKYSLSLTRWFGLLSDPKACNERVQKKTKTGALRCTDTSSFYEFAISLGQIKTLLAIRIDIPHGSVISYFGSGVKRS